MQVAKKCSRSPTFSQPNSMMPRNAASRKKAVMHLVGDDGPSMLPRELGEPRPVGAELVAHDDARHDAEAERHREDLDPEAEEVAVERIAGAQPLEFRAREPAGEADGESREMMWNAIVNANWMRESIRASNSISASPHRHTLLLLGRQRGTDQGLDVSAGLRGRNTVRDGHDTQRHHLRQAKGGKVLAVPAFMAATTIMLARSSSSAERGQTLACAVHPEARNAS